MHIIIVKSLMPQHIMHVQLEISDDSVQTGLRPAKTLNKKVVGGGGRAVSSRVGA
jgi:hypothetical protein